MSTADYVDGLAVWRDLFTDGKCGIIHKRDFVGLRRRASSFEATRMFCGGLMVRDYPRTICCTASTWPSNRGPAGWSRAATGGPRGLSRPA